MRDQSRFWVMLSLIKTLQMEEKYSGAVVKRRLNF